MRGAKERGGGTMKKKKKIRLYKSSNRVLQTSKQIQLVKREKKEDFCPILFFFSCFSVSLFFVVFACYCGEH